MKHKIGGILAMLAMIVSSLSIQFILKEEKVTRYHQHIEARAQDSACNQSDAFTCSHLPIVMIDTLGLEIPGEPIVDENGHTQGFTTTDTKEAMLPVEVKIVDHENRNNYVEDEPTLVTQSLIRVRGSSSRHFNKKSYLLRLIDEQNKYVDHEIMGMSEHYEWAMHGPYLDKTLIRNYMWYNISGEIMNYAPNVRFCEVVLNGEYIGLYVMTETITNGKDCRLNIQEPLENVNQSSYCYRFDRGSGTPIKNIKTLLNQSWRNLHKVNIVYPKSSDLNEERVDYIRKDINDFEKALYSFDYDSQIYGYSQWVDVQSFVDYFIIAEFTQNYDMGNFSTYIYKELNGKYQCVVWDFNSACNNYVDDEFTIDQLAMVDRPLFEMMCKDEKFIHQVIKRYHELRKSYLNEQYLLNYIDETIAYLGSAIQRNNAIYSEAFEPILMSPERNLTSYDEAVKQLKNHIIERGRWLDDNIDILLQYCHESKVKKFNH